MQYFDVDDRSELKPAPEGYRYLDFLGGTRSLRCFLVAADMPRIEFLMAHGADLDEVLQPVHESDMVTVRQDASYALPGFYIVSPLGHFRAFDEMDDLTHLRIQLVTRHVRAAMRDVLGVEQVHVHYEEKPDLSTNVHYWVVPMRYDVAEPGAVLTRLNLKRYLSQFRFAEERTTMLDANRRMRERLLASDLAGTEQALVNRLTDPLQTL